MEAHLLLLTEDHDGAIALAVLESSFPRGVKESDPTKLRALTASVNQKSDGPLAYSAQDGGTVGLLLLGIDHGYDELLSAVTVRTKAPGHPVGGDSAGLLFALLTYFEVRAARLAIASPTRAFAATGAIDPARGDTVLPVVGVGPKIDAALSALPRGGIVIFPAADLQAVSAAQNARALELGIELRAVKSVDEAAHALDSSKARRWDGNPFVGSAPFSADQARVFLGRESEMEQLAQWFERSDSKGKGALVTGASGCGKTSLLWGGLLAQMGRLSPGMHRFASWTPRREQIGQPFDEASIVSGIRSSWAAFGIGDAVKEGVSRGRSAHATGTGTFADSFETLITELPAPGLGEQRWWVLDQAEIVMASIDEALARRLISFLGALMLRGVRLVVALRADQRARWMLHVESRSDSAGLWQEFHLRPLSADAARRQVVQALAATRRVGQSHRSSAGLEDLVRDAVQDSPDVVPFIQRALHDAWLTGPNGAPHLDVTRFALGMPWLARAIDIAASEAWSQLDQDARLAWRDLWCQLAAPGDGTDLEHPKVLIRTPRWTFGPEGRLIDAFVQARFLVTEGGAGSSHSTVRVASTACLNWPGVRDALTSSYPERRAIARLRQNAEAWKAANPRQLRMNGAQIKEAALLLQGPLAGAIDEGDLTEYVHASRQALHRRWARYAFGLVAFGLVAFSLIWQIRKAGMVEASEMLDAGNATASLQAVENMRLPYSNPTLGEQAQLLAALLTQREQKVLQTAQPLTALAVDHEGKRLLTAGDGDERQKPALQLWDLTTPHALPRHMTLHAPAWHVGFCGDDHEQVMAILADGHVFRARQDRHDGMEPAATEGFSVRPDDVLAWSTDGLQLVAKGPHAGSVNLISLCGGAPVPLPTKGGVGQASFSEDGKELVTVSAAATEAVVWDIDGESARQHDRISLPQVLPNLRKIAFDAGHRRLALASADRTALSCDLHQSHAACSSLPLAVFKNDSVGRSVADLAFGACKDEPDCERLAMGLDDGELAVWRLQGRAQVVYRVDLESPIDTLAFSKEGTWLTGWARKGNRPNDLWVVDVAPDIPVRVHLVGHEQPVMQAAFTADARRIVTVSSDGSARVWAIEPDRGLHVLLTDDNGSEARAHFDADGTHAIVTGTKGAVLYELGSLGALPHRIPLGISDHTTDAAFSADGKWLAVALASGQVMVRRRESVLKEFDPIAKAGTTVALSRDGQWLASAYAGDYPQLRWLGLGPTPTPVLPTVPWQFVGTRLAFSRTAHRLALLGSDVRTKPAPCGNSSEDRSAETAQRGTLHLLDVTAPDKNWLTVPVPDVTQFEFVGEDLAIVDACGRLHMWTASSNATSTEESTKATVLAQAGDSIVTANATALRAWHWPLGPEPDFAVPESTSAALLTEEKPAPVRDIASVSASSDGQRIAVSRNQELTVQLWMRRGSEASLLNLKEPFGTAVTQVELSPRGDRMLVVSDYGQVWLLALPLSGDIDKVARSALPEVTKDLPSR